MGIEICCMCQDNTAMDRASQMRLFGRIFTNEDGENPCLDCIEEIEEAMGDIEES